MTAIGKTSAQLALRDPDIRLMLRVRDDEPGAFEELVETYQHRLVAVMHHLVGNAEEAEDLAQEVFLRVYRARKKYRPRAKFSTWLFTIAANLAKNEMRRRKRRRNWSSLDEMQETLKDASLQFADRKSNRQEDLEREQLSGVVGEAIATLPDRYRIALVLRDIEGLAYEEIGLALKIPGGTVRSRINRARLMLKRKLEPWLRRDDIG